MIATGGEVFGSCVGEIDVLAGMENSGFWFCCGWKYLRFILASKAAQYLGLMWEMVPGIEGYLWWSGSDLRNKMPLLLQVLDEVRLSLGIHIILRRSYYSASVAKST